MKKKITIGISCVVLIILLALAGGLLSKDTNKDNTKVAGVSQKTESDEKSDAQPEKVNKETKKEADSLSGEADKAEKNGVDKETGTKSNEDSKKAANTENTEKKENKQNSVPDSSNEVIELPADNIEEEETVPDKTGEDTEGGEKTEVPENPENVTPVPDSGNELPGDPIG